MGRDRALHLVTVVELQKCLSARQNNCRYLRRSTCLRERQHCWYTSQEAFVVVFKQTHRWIHEDSFLGNKRSGKRRYYLSTDIGELAKMAHEMYGV